MKKIVVALVIGGLLLSIGAWFLFDQIILFWATVIGSLMKGSVLMWVIALVRRWFFVELPKLVLFFLLRIGVPIRIRAKVNLAIKVSKLWLRTVAEMTVSKTKSLVGERTAIALAIIATIVIGILAFVFAGTYVVWIIGPARILKPLLWMFRPVFRWLQNFLFKLVANTGLLRLWRWVQRLVPLQYRRQLRSFWSGAIRRRKRMTRRLEERMKKVNT